MWALLTTQPTHANPGPEHARYRREEYNANDFFFQWWNYFIVDSETHEHFYLVFTSMDYPANSTHSDEASTSAVYMKGAKLVDAITETVPIDQLTVTKHFDLAIKVPGRGVLPAAFPSIVVAAPCAFLRPVANSRIRVDCLQKARRISTQ